MESSPFFAHKNLRSFRVDRWLVIPDLNQVEGEGKTVRLEPRIMEVLLCLAARPGKVISRQALFDAVWADTVVCEDVLTRAVSELRQILGDDTTSPHIIETIRKRGYRLIVPVRFDIDEERQAGAPPRDALPVAGSSRPGRASRIRIGAAALLVVIIATLWWTARPIKEAPSSDFLKAVPFTSYPGFERFPAFSPDGSRVAFSWNGKNEDNFDIYIKQLHSESLLRITDNSEVDFLPAWSPAGDEIAFVRQGEESGLYVCAALGGAERWLFRRESPIFGIDWSPDGAWIACSIRDGSEMPFYIALVSVKTMEAHSLTSPESGSFGDWWPAFSPDGEKIAFTRRDGAYQTDVFLVPTAGGKPHRLTASHNVKGGLDWSADGEQILFGAGLKNTSNLWSVSVKGGAAKLLHTRGPADHPSISSGTGSLVYSESKSNYGIVLAELSGKDTPAVKTSHLIASTYSECHARYSPDGRKMLFLSNRSGNPEIWISGSDGENLRQLTEFDGAEIFSPRWSPDGREIAFSAILNGYSSVVVISEAGGVPRTLSGSERHELFNSWSSDGAWLYFTIQPDSIPEIRKVSRDGEQLLPVVSPGREALGEAMDGKSLYYVNPTGHELWKADFEHGVESCEVSENDCADWVDPLVAEGGIYFIRNRDGEGVLHFYRFADKTVDPIIPLPEYTWGSLAISPDGTQFLYDRRKEAVCDLFLVAKIP